jgi:hypothetical protein
VGRLCRLLVSAAVAVPLVSAAAGPAAACACAPLGAKQVVRHADAVIAGRVESQTALDAVNTRSTVRVQGVYRGNVPGTIFVDSNLGPGGGSDCAVLYPVGTVVDPMVLDKLPGGSYTIEPCVVGSIPHMRQLLGTARPPPLAGLSPSASASSAPVPVATATPISGMSWTAVGVGLVLAVILIAAAVRFSGRHAAETASPFDDLPAGPDGDAAGPPDPDTSGPDALGDTAGPPGPDASG